MKIVYYTNRRDKKMIRNHWNVLMQPANNRSYSRRFLINYLYTYTIVNNVYTVTGTHITLEIKYAL